MGNIHNGDGPLNLSLKSESCRVISSLSSEHNSSEHYTHLLLISGNLLPSVMYVVTTPDLHRKSIRRRRKIEVN